MKNSFQIFAVLSLCASLFLPVLAQPGMGAGKMGAGRMGGPGGRMGGPGGGGRMRGMGYMIEQLGLTATQKAKMKTIFTAHGSAVKALFDNKSMPEDQKRTKMRAMHAVSNKKMMAVLTPAQRTKFAAMQAQQRAQRGPGGRM